MKSILKKTSQTAFITIVLAALCVTPFLASASPTDNVTGYAFSDMPNSSDQIKTDTNHYGGRGLGTINMSGNRYGVNLGVDGKFTGYAWSELGGYVQFNPSGQAEGGAYVDAGCLAGNTACPVKGWIRFVAAPNDPQAGGWDGWVKMSDDAVWTNGVTLGAPDAGRNRQMSGYAWGDTVVGWVDFSHVKVTGDVCPNVPGNQTTPPAGTTINTDGDCVPECPNIPGVPKIPDGMVLDDAGNCVPPPQCTYPLVNNPNVPPVPKCVCPVTFAAPVNGQCPTGDPDICENIPGIQLTPADIPVGYAQPTDGSKICPATTCVPGKPCDKCWNVDGVQLSVPSQYNAVYPTNQCVITGCRDLRDTVHYNPHATVDDGSCSICDVNSPSWNETTQSCPRCNPTVPGYNQDTGQCPKQPIKPIYIET